MKVIFISRRIRKNVTTSLFHIMVQGINKEHIFNSILYSLPVGALAAEAIVIFIYFLGHHTFLFQLLMDVIGVLIFLFMFYKKAKSKKLFLIASVISALVFYFVFPW